MRLATFNILHGRSPSDDRVDLDRFCEAVRGLDADVLALQEVDRNQARSSGADFTALAAEAMGAPEHQFVAALSGSPGTTWMAADGDEQPDSAAYGIALLSRYPVRSWQVIRLAPAPVKVPMFFSGSRRPELVRDEPRVAVAATVDAPDGPMTVVSTHLTFIGWWNRRQLKQLRDSLETCVRPLVVMGDLNMGQGRAQQLTRLTPLLTAPTFPAHEPREQLDHILASDGVRERVVGGRAHDLPLSDHQALSVDLDEHHG
jgi:endonuclease/exonuclease/phosphatase family metal-dependent hydrolase